MGACALTLPAGLACCTDALARKHIDTDVHYWKHIDTGGIYSLGKNSATGETHASGIVSKLGCAGTSWPFAQPSFEALIEQAFKLFLD